MLQKLKSLIKLLFSKKRILMSANIIQLGPTELLKEQIALITGGSSGIGYAIAEAYLRAGIEAVIISGRSKERLNESLRKLESCNEHWIGRIFTLQMDVCNIDSLKECFDKIADKVSHKGKISILVNNAGTLGAPFGNAEEIDYDNVMNTNLKGTFFLSQIVAHYMKDNNIKGNILNICSSSSFRPASSAYMISKWGLRGLTYGMAKQLINYGIVVNGLAPGPTATSMLIKDVKEQGIYHSSNPVNRYATAEEVGNMAVVLTSGLGRLIVGDIICMTGGSALITYDDIIYDFN